MVLHADTRLGPGWSGAVLAHIEAGRGAGWFRLRFRAGGIAPRAVERWANLRSRMGLPYGDQGLVLPRGLHDAVGGFPDIPLMEDVAMARRLQGSPSGPARDRPHRGRALRGGGLDAARRAQPLDARPLPGGGGPRAAGEVLRPTLRAGPRGAPARGRRARAAQRPWSSSSPA